eukprot:symbB.v1.2.019500.t1/scaffold1595.1/size109920/9
MADPLPPCRTPRSARYLRPVSRATTAPGRARGRVPELPSAKATEELPADLQPPKTERWREWGQQRWPPVAEGQLPAASVEVKPLRQASKDMQNWQGELWSRSLRKPGLFLQDPIFAQSNISAKELHEEWGDVTPMSRREWPYSGSTISGSCALPASQNLTRWVERPVACGRYALKHMDGTRYQWDTKPRNCLLGL